MIRFFLLSSALLVSAPAVAQCMQSQYGDGVCDCGCGRVDADCPTGGFKVCRKSNCAAGTVPWEHQPESCMTSACGDGWVDAAAGEVCDDGDALARGGCSANCRAVNAGYTCGMMAAGCSISDAGVSGGGAAGGGTAAAGGTASAGGTSAAAGGSVTAGGGSAGGGAAGGGPGKTQPGGCSTVPGFLSLALAGLLARRSKH